MSLTHEYLSGISGRYLYLHILFILSCMVCIFPASAQNNSMTSTEDSLTHLEPRPLTYTLNTRDAIVEYDRNGESNPVVTGLNIQQYDEKYKSQTIETFIEPQQQIEYMINMDQGNIVLFTWEIDGRTYYDLHGHQENVDPDIWTRYAEGRNNISHGSFTAPYSGEHGWFWVNMDSRRVKLTLTISGYYQNIFRIDL